MVRRSVFSSFLHAFRGFAIAFREEKNIKTHAIAGCIALGAALLLSFTPLELAFVVIVISLVIASELLNSALERFSDIVKPRVSGYVERVKDIMAACVLVLSANAVLVGLLLYIPKIIARFF
ncbi:diacylglycerol kinase family protein [Candidatus Uhrbacteria bacterium]|nr:diacylglycerol kinase family protein [Candidatus Uhrbacteria bacterium]